jgi:hypothetical protein
MTTLEYRHEQELPTDPSGYRVGILLSWLLVILGGLFVAFGIFASVGGTRTSLLYGLLVTAAITGTFVGSGLFLIRKAKLGLWGLYLLSSFFACSFLIRLAHAVIAKGQSGAPNAVVGGARLLIWFSIVGYFFKRRRQFTGIWGS